MQISTSTYGIRLTRRENEVCSLMVKGLSSKEIALQLCISAYTVANHRKNIIKKKGRRAGKELAA